MSDFRYLRKPTLDGNLGNNAIADFVRNKMPATKDLPPEILSRATLRGNEYAWPIDDIPSVIEAARRAGLINIGGQLQFRAPGATCECYGVQVNTYASAPKT